MMNQKLSFLGCALGERALPESLRRLASQLTRANPSNYYPVPPKIILPLLALLPNVAATAGLCGKRLAVTNADWG